MKARLRQPIFWMVVLEVALMFTLFVVSWRVYQAHRAPASASSANPSGLASPAAGASAPMPTPFSGPIPKVSPSAKAPVTGGLSFPVDLATLNRDQAALERAEAAALAGLIDGARRYLERVVIPSVRRAERVSAATSAASRQSSAATRKIP